MIIASVERKLQGISQQDVKRALHAPTEFFQLRKKSKTSPNPISLGGHMPPPEDCPGTKNWCGPKARPFGTLIII